MTENTGLAKRGPHKPFDLERARTLHSLGRGMRAIAAELGVSAMTVSRHLDLKRWRPPLPLLTGIPGLKASSVPPASPASPERGE